MEIKQVSLEQMRAELSKPEWNSPVVFIGDVGGTNARLGFARQTDNDGVSLVVTRFRMRNKDIMDLVTFFHAILKAVPASVVAQVRSGVMSVPGPITGGVVGGPFNNLKGVARLSDYPTALFPPGRSAFLNDLEAGGFGVLAASEAHSFGGYFDLMWEGTQWSKTEKVPAGAALGRGHCIVLAPGTGLGASLIHYNEVSKKFGVMALEVGSTTLPLRDDHEYVNTMAAKVNHRPSYEDMVSGGALERHYTAIAGDHKLSAGEIAQRACQGDANAVKAMRVFNKYLMRLGSEVSMGFIPLTVVVIGDNVVHNRSFYADPENVELMKREARDHPMERFGFISRVTYLRQKKLLNLNLIGCYRCGLPMAKKSLAKSKL